MRARDSAKHADIIVFPELAVCGYIPEDLLFNTNFLRACEEAIAKLQRKIKNDRGPAILIGAPRRVVPRRTSACINKSALYNSVFLISSNPNDAIAFRDKGCIPNYGVFDEARYFSKAQEFTPINFTKINHNSEKIQCKLGVMVCEDLWSSEIASKLAENNADILIVVNASPFEIKKDEQRIANASALVKKTNIPLLYVNQVGGQDELLYDGSSFALNTSGEIIKMPAFQEQVTIFRYQNNSINIEKTSPTPKSSHSSTSTKNNNEIIYRAITMGIHDYLAKNSITNIVLGLSGGIDSALCATLACDAISPERVTAIFLPSPYTSRESHEDALELANTLRITLHNIPINEPMQVIAKAFSDAIHNNYTGITAENAQARIRAILLMAFSNHTNALLLATGNKSEYATGYTTIYGDMCGGYAPLKDLYKTQVLNLAQWRNTLSDKPIPTRIITKHPSAELRPHQRDDETLPPYEKLDRILQYLIEGSETPEGKKSLAQEPEITTRILALLHASEHKRRQAPPGPKIGQRAFGRDRRYPISKHFNSTCY